MRSIGRETISKAATIFTLAVSVAAISVMALNIACGDQFTSSELLFEQVSAYATVGLSLDVTPQLNTIDHHDQYVYGQDRVVRILYGVHVRLEKTRSNGQIPRSGNSTIK